MTGFIDIYTIVYGVLTAGLGLSFLRLLAGPGRADRFVALELVGMHVVAFIGVAAIQTKQAVLLDAALIIALISFIGLIASARYLEKGVRDD